LPGFVKDRPTEREPPEAAKSILLHHEVGAPERIAYDGCIAAGSGVAAHAFALTFA
jgi:hypothetical protein